MMKQGHDAESAQHLETEDNHRTLCRIDVSLELSSVCVVARKAGSRRKKIASDPALVAFFEALGFAVKRIGLEAGPLSQWLHAGLKRAGFEAILLGERGLANADPDRGFHAGSFNRWIAGSPALLVARKSFSGGYRRGAEKLHWNASPRLCFRRGRH
jgi:hypothetical protein